MQPNGVENENKNGRRFGISGSDLYKTLEKSISKYANKSQFALSNLTSFANYPNKIIDYTLDTAQYKPK